MSERRTRIQLTDADRRGRLWRDIDHWPSPTKEPDKISDDTLIKLAEITNRLGDKTGIQRPGKWPKKRS